MYLKLVKNGLTIWSVYKHHHQNNLKKNILKLQKIRERILKLNNFVTTIAKSWATFGLRLLGKRNTRNKAQSVCPISKSPIIEKQL